MSLFEAIKVKINMTKCYVVLIILCLLFSACNSAHVSQNFSPAPQAPPPPPKIEWNEFISEEGRFKILFPGIPSQSTKETDTPNGKVQTQKFTVVLLGDYFEVTYSEFPAEPDVNQNQLKSYYDSISNYTLQAQPTILISERDVWVNGKLGRELAVSLNETYVKYRFFLIGNRIYQASTKVGISRKDEQIIQDRLNKFLDSFQIIEK